MENLNFSQALAHLKAGLKVSRKGWNLQGMSYALQTPDAGSANTLPYFYLNIPITNDEGDVTGLDRVPREPSHTDILAEDWFVVREE